MDETDGNRRGECPFGDDLAPAVQRIDEAERTDASVPDIDELVGPPQTLESEIQGVWALQAAVSAAILGVIAAVAFSVLSVGGPWIGGAVFAVGVVIGIVLSVLRYRIWTYQVREDSLYLRRGVVTRVETVAPYVRIQHVDTRRGPIERVFGLATTVVYTAGSRGADVAIPGLTPERAADLQTRLKQLAIAAEGDDAV
ncbi:PH domain-containing protein [Natronomonas sp. F2-12]|jgi:membrane protein YdbS with pleckstrin-like domain|uniref:PH domain-containing protein n=1 Tax=Natronomonas aquatica TaxID=2841590 RepID=A0A9R1CUW6_9EURY|nr:PH domain-containing protein [Natronomonas aquatica]MCQ4334325.1 PH domain-containing protein [Natronomonas aquatica]